MEDHLQNRERLVAEWRTLCADASNDKQSTSYSIALSEINMKKNRYSNCIPCKFKEKLSIEIRVGEVSQS